MTYLFLCILATRLSHIGHISKKIALSGPFGGNCIYNPHRHIVSLLHSVNFGLPGNATYSKRIALFEVGAKRRLLFFVAGRNTRWSDRVEVNRETDAPHYIII